MDPKKILFLTDNFPPEVNAPANRTFEHAVEWVKNKDIDLTIITCFPNAPNGKIFKGYKNKFYQKSKENGYTLIRVWTYISPNKGFYKRIIDYFSFSLMSFLIGLFIKSDIIVATSPQFFTAISGRLLSFFKRIPWIMEVRDLWPESIAAVGALNKSSLLYGFLEKIEYKLYKSSKKIIVVTDTFKEKISNLGIDNNKIFVHKNGVLIENFKPLKKDISLFDKYPYLFNKKIFGYVGTHGMAHALSFIVKSLSDLKKEIPNAHFIFIGDGAEKENLINQANKLKVKNISFFPLMQKKELMKFYSLIDFSLVNLSKSETFKTVIPSKIFEAAALRKPICLGLEGETKQIIKSYNAGVYFEPENSLEFINACKKIIIKENIINYKIGCKKLAEDFNRKKIAYDMLNTIIN